MRYKVTLRTGQTIEVEDKRALADLSAELCDRGFVTVQRIISGYSETYTEIALFERAVSMIEAA